ncbi:hypothetical protein jhhlp_006785 [Lomentospora prolificans]|uniref:Inclusion body clearance protein IML2 n=1 Tax=Lomentospora prolificans TaxID=41688 RepID=A0A2N3N2Q2_9PEZI|nr:hypothetical protein jhhlp_006785 [Lomentospora prolificans]
MVRIGSWFGAAPVAKPVSKPTVKEPSKEELLAREMANIEDAFASAELIINDDMDGAEARLKKGDSSYHQLALAVIGFARSILGFEKGVMIQTSTQLANCEARALADQKRAQKEFAECASCVYPAGTEYSLVHTEAMLMSAVVGVLHESLTEGIKSFYKLRKAYFALEAIMQLDIKGVKSDLPARRKSLKEEFAEDKMPGSFSDDEFSGGAGNDDDCTADVLLRNNTASTFKPAVNDASDSSSVSSVSSGNSEGGSSATGPGSVAKTSFDSDAFTNPRDAFIHSGAAMCFGALLFIFTLVPPTLSKLLSIVGFRGDRERGIRMLWESTTFPNVHGAIAGVVLLSYYNGLLGLSDILPPDHLYDEMAEIVGLPQAKCNELLARMKARYPQSGFWQLEQSRMYANSRRLADAIDTLKSMPKSNMKQVDALACFETAIDALFIMDWNLMRDSFVKCMDLNEWSRTLYNYMAGCAEVELYRDAFHRPGGEEDAEKHKKRAEDFLTSAPATSGKKRFLAKQLPFEVFALRKLQKWEARAKELNIDLVDAIGISPAQELLYLYNGGKRVDMKQAEEAMGYLRWERCTAKSEHVEKMKDAVDEGAIKAVCESALLRAMGKVQEARERLEEDVLKHDKHCFKGGTKEDYILPCAHYEMGVLSWTEACSSTLETIRENMNGQEVPPEEEDEEKALENFRRAKIDECRESLDKAGNWEAFVLDGRCGMRVQTGIETLKWYEKRMGWC